MAEYSFDGLAFGPIASGLVPRISPGDLQYTERHVPYSQLNVVDEGGSLASRYTTQIRILGANVAAWEAKRGASGPLVVDGAAPIDALLVRLGNHQMSPRREYHLYDAEWVIGSVA